LERWEKPALRAKKVRRTPAIHQEMAGGGEDGWLG
jgi:hypothetical protein